MKFTVYEVSTGQVLFSGTADDTSVLAGEGQAVLDGESYVSGWVADGVHYSQPEKPSPYHVFNYAVKQWEDPRTLQDLKDARRAYVNTERLKANQAYFAHEGKQIAADALSRGDIDAINGEINNTGAFPGGWPGAWKCLDNTWLPVDTVGSWKSLYTSMVNQGTANFGHAQALKAQIEAATSQADVEAVVW